jgi:hypothetical protein
MKKSGRSGSTVYYDPANRGPYSDGQDALSDVPAGGTFALAEGTYEVGTEGRLLIDRPVHIVGASEKASRQIVRNDGGRQLNTFGTRIKNRSVDKPTIEYRAGESNHIEGVLLRGIRVSSNTDAPVVRFYNTIKSGIVDSAISGGSQAPKGVVYDGGSFFARMFRSTVTAFTDVGIHVRGTGYDHEFIQVHCASGRPECTALQTERHRTIVMGGEFAATAETGTAIRFYNPESGGTRYGGLVFEPGIEHTARCIDVDGEGPFDGVQVYGSLLSLWAQESEEYQGGGSGIHFGNARNCKLIYPVTNSDGNLARWTKRSRNCGVITDAKTASQVSLVNDGAATPWASVAGAADAVQMENMPTSVPLTVEFNRDSNSPVYYDGSEWRQLRGQSYTPPS